MKSSLSICLPMRTPANGLKGLSPNPSRDFKAIDTVCLHVRRESRQIEADDNDQVSKHQDAALEVVTLVGSQKRLESFVLVFFTYFAFIVDIA